MTNEEFIFEIEKLGIEVNNEKLDKLEKFYNLLIEWNNKINLTRITSKQDVYLKHFYDSLTLIKVIDLNKISTLCDVGTGAGFPGIVLKIFYPNLNITLVDSLLKRVKYLNTVITARAVANIEKLLTYTMHLLKKDGKLIAMKGNIEDEMTKEVQEKISKKYNIENILKFYLPKENSNRSLVIIKNK